MNYVRDRCKLFGLESYSKTPSNQDAVVPNQLRQLHRLPALKENQNRQTPARSAIFYDFGGSAYLRVRAINSPRAIKRCLLPGPEKRPFTARISGRI